MGYQVTIEPLGETIEVEDDQTILDAALRAGIWLPYACNHGLCGTFSLIRLPQFFTIDPIIGCEIKHAGNVD